MDSFSYFLPSFATSQKVTPQGFIYDEAWEWNETTGAGPQWASRNAFGITKYVRLATYSPVSFTDVVVYVHSGETK